ncbi:bis(5'-nucleosyl)-tetraphosphatase (symmetrical) YqeK [Leptolyngbya ohadii]|uniref:bis(5'-nucleosyl)-tetraphosphatase (symmetrical) YqeK n=1 Tax=Leptolyngbya ohadii TaxID=1962290 RepID=UPI0019D46E33|nr:bis(5'-nucleosyl)-tetraphosphatase (symmetrical) YqeK [Leptolyngbya ohadii]
MQQSLTLRDPVLAWLHQNVPLPRIEHILRVEQMAIDLAEVHQVNGEKAALAGLMHDLAKFFKSSRLLEIARQSGLPLDPVDEANPHLLHADISAIVAREEFGVEDAEILSAIANHTLGRPGMDDLSCIVYLADTLEPGRGDTPELNYLRQAAQQNLAQAVWQTSDYTVQYLIQTQRLIHPRALLTRNWFLQQAKTQQKFTESPKSLPVSS